MSQPCTTLATPPPTAVKLSRSAIIRTQPPSIASRFITMSTNNQDHLDDLFKQKRVLRTKVRKSMDPALRAQEDNAIQSLVLTAPWFKSCRRLCAYVSCGALREVDTSKVWAEILQSPLKGTAMETKAKSLFVIMHSVDRSSSKVYELKIQPGGQVIGLCKGERSETRDDYDSQQLLEPVAHVPCHSTVESARMFNSSKLFLWLNERLNKKPSNGSVLDLVTKSVVPFKPSPKAHKGPSTVISAYGKLYYLANPDCVPEDIPKPSFQRFDPTTNCWKSLSPFPDYCKRYWYRKRVEGYAVCYGFILFSTADRVVKYIVYDIARDRWHKDVKQWQRANHVSHEPVRGRAVVVGDTIYAFSIFWRTVICFNFWWDVDRNGEFTFYVSPQSALRGLEINRAFKQVSFGCREEPKEGYLAHLGNLDFCLVQTHIIEETTSAFKIKHDGQQELCITVLQVVAEGGRRRRIKTLHSTVCEVETPDCCAVRLGPCFIPDCDDNEPTVEEERVTTESMPMKVKQWIREDEDEETIAPKKMKTELN